jgi:phage baseplate assembly protein W
MAGISVKLPLSIDESDGAYALHKELEQVVKQNLKMLLLTIPGERIMNPEFGVGIPQFLFEQNTIETQKKISTRLQNQVARYLPFIEIMDLYTGPPQNELMEQNSLKITIKYFVPAISKEDYLSISIPNEVDVSTSSI